MATLADKLKAQVQQIEITLANGDQVTFGLMVPTLTRWTLLGAMVPAPEPPKLADPDGKIRRLVDDPDFQRAEAEASVLRILVRLADALFSGGETFPAECGDELARGRWLAQHMDAQIANALGGWLARAVSGTRAEVRALSESFRG